MNKPRGVLSNHIPRPPRPNAPTPPIPPRCRKIHEDGGSLESFIKHNDKRGYINKCLERFRIKSEVIDGEIRYWIEQNYWIFLWSSIKGCDETGGSPKMLFRTIRGANEHLHMLLGRKFERNVPSTSILHKHTNLNDIP